MGITSKLTSPNAAVLIWNYQDRINADGATDPHKIEQVIISTASLISISTSKSKAHPAGNFELRLAPTFNWVTRITPGSWCVINMSQNTKIPDIDKGNPGKANRKYTKMLGRIDSVRCVIDVDQETGARRSTYIATGLDWGCVFDTYLYIDPIARNNVVDGKDAIGHAFRLLFNNMQLERADAGYTIPSSSQVIESIIKLWGAPVSGVLDSLSSLTGGAVGSTVQASPTMTPFGISSEAQFQLPVPVAKYFGMGGLLGSSVSFVDAIKRYHGTLTAYDKYGGDAKEGLGIPDPMSFYGLHTFWQLLTDNSNPIVNELVADIRWEGESPKLALYHRAKPFVNRKKFLGSDEAVVKTSTSNFSNVRRVQIPVEDVVGINLGTNFRDKVNFVEIRPSFQLGQENYETQVKFESQTLDRKAYSREGFKPMIQNVTYMPYDGSTPAPLKATKWKFLLREWHYNTHLMVNGAISFIGQDDYIQVGDNIMIDAKILGTSGQSEKFNAQQSGKVFLLAHVEGISHQFTVNAETGARSFVTTVQFVRGIISDKNGKIVGSGSAGPLSGSDFGFDTSSIPGVGGGGDPLDGIIDADATKVGTSQEKKKNVMGTSTKNDPDKEKLKGG